MISSQHSLTNNVSNVLRSRVSSSPHTRYRSQKYKIKKPYALKRAFHHQIENYSEPLAYGQRDNALTSVT